MKLLMIAVIIIFLSGCGYLQNKETEAFLNSNEDLLLDFRVTRETIPLKHQSEKSYVEEWIVSLPQEILTDEFLMNLAIKKVPVGRILNLSILNRQNLYLVNFSTHFTLIYSVKIEVTSISEFFNRSYPYLKEGLLSEIISYPLADDLIVGQFAIGDSSIRWLDSSLGFIAPLQFLTDKLHFLNNPFIY